MTDPLPPDPYGIQIPEEYARDAPIRRAVKEQEARWAKQAAEEEARTFAGQLKLAFVARPFVPFVLHFGGRMQAVFEEGDVDRVKVLDDAIMWPDKSGKTWLVRLDQIDWVRFGGGNESRSTET
jgi:hypothetical protein